MEELNGGINTLAKIVMLCPTKLDTGSTIIYHSWLIWTLGGLGYEPIYKRHRSNLYKKIFSGVDADSTSRNEYCWEWLRANQLALNVAKKFNFLGSGPRLRQWSFTSTIWRGYRRVAYIKYFDVLLDNKLTFANHIDFLLDKDTSKIGALRELNSCPRCPTALLLNKSLVILHFPYCDTIYLYKSNVDHK